MEYCCYVWAGAPSCYLKWLDKLTGYKNEYAGLLVLHLLLLLNPGLIAIGITLEDVLLNWLNWFHFLFLDGGLLVILIDYIIFLSLFFSYRMLCFDILSKWLLSLELTGTY